MDNNKNETSGTSTNTARAKHILHWIASGQFTRLGRAILDQFLIRSAKLRRSVRNHSAIQKWRQKKQLKAIMANYYDAITPDPHARQKVALILRDGDIYPKSSAFIRLIAPLTHPILRPKISIKLYRENTVDVDEGTNICIVQRTAYDSEEIANKFISAVRQRGITLIFDNDDAFHNIDTTHPEHSLHTDKVAAMNRIVQAADQIWLSVAALRRSYASAKGKLSVIENSLDERTWNKAQPKKSQRLAQPKSGPIRMVCIGTVTHDADFKMILPALDALAQKYPKTFTLTIIGVTDDLADRPWIERIYQPRFGSIYPVFVRWFCAQGPYDIGLAPLVDSEFNRNKSDIKCLDYLGAGIRPVASDILPYQSKELGEFIITAKNTRANWIKVLEQFIKNPDEFRRESAKVVADAQEYIWQKRSSAQTAKRMLELLDIKP